MFGRTSTATFASSLPGAIVTGGTTMTGWPRTWANSNGWTWSGVLASGQSRFNFSVTLGLSPCVTVALSMVAARSNGVWSLTASIMLPSRRVIVWMIRAGWTGQAAVAV